MTKFSKEHLRAARRADLYSYLKENHGEMFTREGNSIRMKTNHSISIKRSYTGYLDFATGETGNSVDFLVRYMNYSIEEAIKALCGIEEVVMDDDYAVGDYWEVNYIANDLKAQLPHAAGNNRRLEAYLLSRGISSETIHMLTYWGRMYQDAAHGNIVFPSKEKDWAELHGTYTYGPKVYHGIAKHSRVDGYWDFAGGEKPIKGYVCEAAIDAISLYELHLRKGQDTSAYYISIGGASKQAAIERIANKITAVLAVDNDEAGKICRSKNPELSFIIPEHKDWNDDLLLHKTSIL